MEANPLNQSQQQIGHVSLTQVSAKEFRAKFNSKRECYNFLAGECEVYLPPYGKSAFFSSIIRRVLQLHVFHPQTTSPFTS